MRYLALDTETTGLSPEDSVLLTGNLQVLNEELDKIDEFDFGMKHPIYHVYIGALKVNKIDLIKHDSMSEDQISLEIKINNFLLKHTDYGKTKLVVIGHNPKFDIGFLKKHLPKVLWDKYLSYHVLDTVTVALFCQLRGLIPTDINLRLTDLTKHFGIEHSGAHGAKADTDACIQVLKCMINLRKKKVK